MDTTPNANLSVIDGVIVGPGPWSLLVLLSVGIVIGVTVFLINRKRSTPP